MDDTDERKCYRHLFTLAQKRMQTSLEERNCKAYSDQCKKAAMPVNPAKPVLCKFEALGKPCTPVKCKFLHVNQQSAMFVAKAKAKPKQPGVPFGTGKGKGDKDHPGRSPSPVAKKPCFNWMKDKCTNGKKCSYHHPADCKFWMD